MRILITLLSIITFTAQACPSYQPLKSGSTAPCDGHFFNNETEKRIRKDVRDNELRKKQIELKDLQVQKVTEDRDKWKKEAEEQSKVSHSKDNDLRNGFLYGVGATVLAILLGGRLK